jgi:hypothetical protein
VNQSWALWLYVFHPRTWVGVIDFALLHLQYKNKDTTKIQEESDSYLSAGSCWCLFISTWFNSFAFPVGE